METTEKRPRERRGPTLLQLLSVVAVIAVVAAILVPQPMHSHPRSKVQRVRYDLRSLASALEAYSIDHDAYPAQRPLRNYAKRLGKRAEKRLRKTGGWDFSAIEPGTSDSLHGLTTPVAYMTAMPFDPFQTSAGIPFAYHKDGEIGWILFSPGPDGVFEIIPELDYDASVANPTIDLLLKTYDVTNGAKSSGDIWRFASQ